MKLTSVTPSEAIKMFHSGKEEYVYYSMDMIKAGILVEPDEKDALKSLQSISDIVYDEEEADRRAKEYKWYPSHTFLGHTGKSVYVYTKVRELR